MKLGLISVFAVCLAASAPAETLKQYLESMKGKYEKAMMRKNIKAFGNLVRANATKDFVYKEGGQKMDMETMISTMGQGFAMMGTVTKVETKTLSLKANQYAGTVVDLHTVEYTATVPKDPKKHHYVYIGKSTDTYKKVNGKWKLASMVWSDSKWTMDGKPFDPMAGGPPK